MLNVECWMFIWMLNVYFNVECWMLTVECWMLNVDCWMLNVECWLGGVSKTEIRFIRFISVQKPRTPEGYIPSVHLDCKITKSPLNDLDRWNVECWVLSVEWFRECWMLSVECWFLPNGLNGASLIQHSTLNTQHSTFSKSFNIPLVPTI